MEWKRAYRKTLRYRVKWFFYTLEWKDVKGFFRRLYEDFAAISGILILLALILIIPHMFH